MFNLEVGHLNLKIVEPNPGSEGGKIDLTRANSICHQQTLLP